MVLLTSTKKFMWMGFGTITIMPTQKRCIMMDTFATQILQNLILDAGMTELIRPALYQAFHKIENIKVDSNPSFSYDVVGPICESSDCFGKAVLLPESKRGQLVAIRSAGAYGECMANSYNMRTLNPSMFY